MLPSQIRSSIYSHGFHYKFQIKVECLQNSKQTLNSPKTQKGLSLNLSDYQELILQNVLNYEFNSNICKHKAFYLFKFIFSPLNSRSFVFLKYPKGVLICQQRNTFGKFWIVWRCLGQSSCELVDIHKFPEVSSFFPVFIFQPPLCRILIKWNCIQRCISLWLLTCFLGGGGSEQKCSVSLVRFKKSFAYMKFHGRLYSRKLTRHNYLGCKFIAQCNNKSNLGKGERSLFSIARNQFITYNRI